jgi:hypothetical protein
MTLLQVAHELCRRLISIFECDAQGRRPVFGGAEKFQRDALWRDHLLFYEYFHGDTGAGVGASHQTGWTGLIAPVITLMHRAEAQSWIKYGRQTTPHARSLT